jgi:hypothetical protein
VCAVSCPRGRFTPTSATPRRPGDLRELVAAANDWRAPQTFTRRLAYAAYVDGVYTSLNNGTLRRWLPGGLERTEIPGADLPATFTATFHDDRSLYEETAEILRRNGGAAS